MSWSTRKWLNLRGSDAYVADDAGQTPITNNDGDRPVYPKSVTLDSDTFNAGWVSLSGDGARDRSTGLDKRLSGCHLVANSSGIAGYFQCELLGGASDYEIQIASGDYVGLGATNPHIKIYDGATLRATVDGTAGINNFMDASGADLSPAAWAGANGGAILTLPFSSTTASGGNPMLRIVCGDTATAGYSPLVAVGIRQVAAPSPALALLCGQFPIFIPGYGIRV